MGRLDLTTREGWGARTTRTGRPMGKVARLVVHHFWRPDVPATASRAQEREVMRGVEAYHASQGWSAAPGYQYVVFDSGRAYEGVGFGRQGVHTAGFNSIAIALCFGNDGDADEPTDAAWEAMQRLRRVAVRRGHLDRDYLLTGHRDHAPKSCPGNLTYPRIGRVRQDPARRPAIEEDGMFCRRGDKGHAVQLLQLRLRALGFYSGDIDGDYGPATSDAVLAMRKARGSKAKSGDVLNGWAAYQLQLSEAAAAVG